MNDQIQEVKLPDVEEIFTINEIAKMLKISRPKVYDLIETGRIEAVNISKAKLRNYWRITKSALDKYLANSDNK